LPLNDLCSALIWPYSYDRLVRLKKLWKGNKMTSKKTNSLKLNEAEPKTNSSNKLNANQLIDLFNSRDIIDRSTLDAMDMKRLEMMERIVGNIYRKGE
jgi:hypothetical protein